MQALLFEVEPREGHEDHYFKHAAALRPLLEEQSGLLFIDRFRSLKRPNIILSHSRWRDEAALAKWRTNAKHHGSQAAGRNEHFKDYRIRISHVIKRYARGEETAEWTLDGAYREDSSDQDSTERPRFVTIVGAEGEAFSEGGEAFRSVNFENAFLAVYAAESEAEADRLLSRAMEAPHVTDALFAKVSRDYGMFERDEAPQYFPAPGSRE